jgi:hypothetical protein
MDWVLLEAAIVLALAVIAVAAQRWPSIALRVAGLALVVGVLAAVAIVRWPRPGQAAARPDLVLVGVAVALAVGWAVRAWAATTSPVPLGYDYGFYKATFDAYATGDLPLRSQPDWMASQFEPGLPALHAILQGVAGLSSYDHLRYLHPALAAFNVLFAFIVARAYAGSRAGLLAAAIMAVSALQIEAHAFLYEKNLVALGLLLVALFLLRRRAWLACGLVLGAVGIWHRPTVLLAALGFAAAVLADPVLRRSWKGWTVTGGVALVLFMPVWLAMPDTFLGVGQAVAEQSQVALTSPGGESSGTFYELREGLRLMAPYLPLALAGIAVAWRWPALRGPTLMAGLAFAYIALELPLNRRFLLMADAVAAVVAGAALVPLAGKRASAVAAACVVLTAAVGFATLAEPSRPHRWLTEDQWAQLTVLHELPDDAVLVADNLRSPYVLSESGRLTYGPGLFGDPHDRGDWNRFWSGQEGEDLAAFMAAYGPQVYVVQVDDPGPDWGAASLRDPEFELRHDEGGLRIWRYAGGTA